MLSRGIYSNGCLFFMCVYKRTHILIIAKEEQRLIKLCKDFTFNGHNLSDFGYISVEFDDTNEATFGLSRELIKGETTRYRTIANHLGAEYEDVLTFDVHIVKKESEYSNDVEKMEISREDLREITRWLMATERPTWLTFINSDGHIDDFRYCGVFTDIKPFQTNRLYGLRLTFTNNSSFAYTNNITSVHAVNGNSTVNITNNSDLITKYNYPNIRMVTTRAGQQEVYMCNLSDAIIIDEGNLSLGGGNFSVLMRLHTVLENLARTRGYFTVEYVRDRNGNFISFCDNTGMQFRFIAHDGRERKCVAFFNPTTGRYHVVQGGFILLTLRQHLAVNINSRQLSIFDGIGRMILLSDLGIRDVDYAYFPRLRSGNNTLLFYGLNCTFTIDRIEERKVGILE